MNPDEQQPTPAVPGAPPVPAPNTESPAITELIQKIKQLLSTSSDPNEIANLKIMYKTAIDMAAGNMPVNEPQPPQGAV